MLRFVSFLPWIKETRESVKVIIQIAAQLNRSQMQSEKKSGAVRYIDLSKIIDIF